ncbi:SDR family oxidoreductase [Streptomyces sp. NPDC059477]|uniref:SDR family oxidoreductase n=1 Tax=Streptomyces sp. NPDC059477 TaxID=3346847 RepID=UPI00367700B9
MGVLGGRTALVTGASRGIGRAVADRPARVGARVGGHDGRDEEAAKDTVAAIEATDEEMYDRAHAVNAKAPFFVIKHGPGRLRDQGWIVNVTAGTDATIPAIAATHMAMGAVTALTRSLAAEPAPRGITANSVAPGYIDTDLTREVLADPEVRAHAESVSVFDRVGTATEVADVVAFLASPDARWVTGQHLDATRGDRRSPGRPEGVAAVRGQWVSVTLARARGASGSWPRAMVTS